MPVVVLDVLGEDDLKMPAAKHEESIEALERRSAGCSAGRCSCRRSTETSWRSMTTSIV
jgi:hypothetical protein